MQNFMKTIISAVKAWTDGRIQESVADWNENDSSKDSYIKNKTHYDTRKTEAISYTFDGNLEGREIVSSDTEIFVKIAEDIPTVENLIGGEVKVHTPNSTESMTLSKNEVINVSDDLIGVANIILIALNDTELNGFQFKKGIWSCCILDNGVPIIYAMKLSYQIATGELKKLDSKYLPNNLATIDDVNAKMDMDNPVGTGSFSMNRKAGTIIGHCSHAEGEDTAASGASSHAEGYYTTASGPYSHAEGEDTAASSASSHAEGHYTTASGAGSHAEGNGTTASNSYSHAEGNGTTASGLSSHAEGCKTKATSSSSDTALTTHFETAGYYTHAEGYGTVAYGTASHAEGNGTTASGLNSHAEGCLTKATSSNASPSPTGVTTKGYCTHAEGYGTVAYGTASHAEGNGTTASGLNSHSEGYHTTASGDYSHAEGINTKAFGYTSHAEGCGTTASGEYSHTEGNMTTASGNYSHTEGNYTTASGDHSHAEGGSTTASGACSHAEGQSAVASGSCSHAEGIQTTALGNYSHSEGGYTTTSGAYSHVQGRYNVVDSTTNDAEGLKKYAHIVGNGTSDTARSNAHTLDWNGVGWFQGGLQVGGTAQDNGAQTVMLNGDKEIILASFTEGSTKKFKLTIDDNGVLTASEIETTT